MNIAKIVMFNKLMNVHQPLECHFFVSYFKNQVMIELEHRLNLPEIYLEVMQGFGLACLLPKTNQPTQANKPFTYDTYDTNMQ